MIERLGVDARDPMCEVGKRRKKSIITRMKGEAILRDAADRIDREVTNPGLMRGPQSGNAAEVAAGPRCADEQFGQQQQRIAGPPGVAILCYLVQKSRFRRAVPSLRPQW